MPVMESGLREEVRGVRLGLASRGFFPGLEPEVEGLVREAIQKLASLGAEVEEVEVSFADYASVTYMSIAGPESALYHREHLRSRRQDYTGPTADFFEVGMFVPGYRYVQGLKACGRFIREMAEVFKRVDALLTPTVPIVAPKIEASSNWPPLFQCTMPFSLAGVPALSVPCGFTREGLPVGLQIVGRWWDEGGILGLGRAYERVTHWHTRRPPIG
jgi:aspartyl-tRNA(Asn)/glutamyl-tRNA(Gln) amidotransferase subunit A